MGLREWPPGIEFENLSLDRFKLEDAASGSRAAIGDTTIKPRRRAASIKRPRGCVHLVRYV
jgi:hypothetical protein